MKLVQLLFTVSNGLRAKYRKLENIEKKLINTKWSIIFNNVCLKENIMPNYTKIRNRDPAVREASVS